MTYNAEDKRVADENFGGQITATAWDGSHLVAVTNALGNATIYEYDLRGRKTYEGGATYPVQYTYDVFGNKTTMMTCRREGRGNGEEGSVGDTTTWLYDEASGVMTNKVYADGKGPRYDYTSDGKLAKRTWARGITTDYSYDNWGNLTNTVYSDGTPTISLFYDVLGRQTEARDAAGVTTFLYDSFGSLTNETVVGVAGTNTIIRYWDEFGRTAGYALNGTCQTTIGYEPNKGRISTMETFSVHSPTPTQNSNSFQWTYLDGSDLKSSLDYPNGLTASWTYDANNQLLQVCNVTPTNIISQYDYTYDAAGRRIACAKSGSAFTQDDTVAYGYNNRSELTNAVAAVDANYQYAYDFDDIGNREASSESGTNSVYTANQLNQYTMVGRVVPNAPQDAFVPQFDDDGNQTLIKTATGIWSVTYNGENRPIFWVQGTNTISMSYDRMGRRVMKNDQRFVYDGYLQIANSELQTLNSKLQTFIWDPTEPVATRPLVWNRENSSVYYVHDGNKNVSEVVESNGDVVAHYEYAPFGATNNSLNSLYHDSPWRFSSEYAEDDLALVCYNYRFYDPNIGVWLCRDPYKEEESTFFVDNNPIGAFDWLGLTTERSSCISISHSKNFDFRNKPLGRIGLFKFTGTLASGYSLKGEACLKCCKTGANAGIKKLSGSGEVSLSGTGGLTATFGFDFKSSLFWDFYRLYLFGGVQASVSLSGFGTGSFEFDGCEGAGTLNASISDSLEFAFRAGVEGYLKRRGGRRNGNWHYNTVAKVAALIKGSVSSSLSTTLSCDTEKCVLTSSIGGFDANIGVEFTFKRKTLSLDIWRFHGDGVVLAETEFESPLKGWAEQ